MSVKYKARILQFIDVEFDCRYLSFVIFVQQLIVYLSFFYSCISYNTYLFCNDVESLSV